ncbi:MAG: hypothetical protein JNL04_11660 [Rhodospirillaceae bacterium]|nr:hypothetical protein [Rhodospirillaceae bacterium]
MRRPALLLSLLLILGQFALGLHQIEHRFEPAAPDQGACGLCAVADHMDGAPGQVAVLPSDAWALATFHPIADPRPNLARPVEIRARAPPVLIV